MVSKRQKDFRWRYQPRNDQDKILLEYIQNYPTASTTEAIIAALRAYWLPIALAHDTNFDVATKREIASKYADILRYQADAICHLVGIPSSVSSTVNNFKISELASPEVKEARSEDLDPKTNEQLVRQEGGTGLGEWAISM